MLVPLEVYKSNKYSIVKTWILLLFLFIFRSCFLTQTYIVIDFWLLSPFYVSGAICYLSLMLKKDLFTEDNQILNKRLGILCLWWKLFCCITSFGKRYLKSVPGKLIKLLLYWFTFHMTIKERNLSINTTQLFKSCLFP